MSVLIDMSSTVDTPITVALLAAALIVIIGLGPAGARAFGRPRRMHDRSTTAPGQPLAMRARRHWQSWRGRRRERAAISPAAVAEWCDALARSLRAGHSLRAALSATVPTDPALAHRSAPLRHAIERGTTIAEAVADLEAENTLHRRRPTPHLALAAAVVATSASIGGATSASLDRLAGSLRLRAADGEERTAHSAQARLSAHVLTVVPLGLLGLLAATDPDVLTLLRSGIGLTLLAFGLGLNLAGWCWMRHIIEARR